MPRRRQGTIQAFTLPDGTIFYRARLRLRDGSRPWKEVPAEHCGSEDDARGFARRLQALEERHGELCTARREALQAPDHGRALARRPRANGSRGFMLRARRGANAPCATVAGAT
jgi:hypothetical protein